jgi:hypothetical protein
MFLGSKVRPVHRADNLTAICEPIEHSTQLSYSSVTDYILAVNLTELMIDFWSTHVVRVG